MSFIVNLNPWRVQLFLDKAEKWLWDREAKKFLGPLSRAGSRHQRRKQVPGAVNRKRQQYVHCRGGTSGSAAALRWQLNWPTPGQRRDLHSLSSTSVAAQLGFGGFFPLPQQKSWSRHSLLAAVIDLRKVTLTDTKWCYLMRLKKGIS